jgi:hypothetical protein
MPPVAAAVGAVAGFLGSTAFTIAGIGVSWGTVLMTTTSLASGLIASGRKPRGAVADPGRNIGIGVDAFMPRKCVYGRAAVSGDRIFADTYSSNQKLGQVLALSIGLISGVDTVMMNETEISLSGTSVTTAPWNGVMSLEFKDGTDAKTAYTGLAAGSSYWTTDHRGRGVSDAFWELTYDQEKYSGGIPVPLFIGDYALVYDPRKDTSIGGDGDHRYDDPTTWEFSDSGPLQALHYLIGIYQNGKRVWGLGVPVDLIDLDSFAAAADVCEYEIEGKPRFKTGGRVSDDDDPREVLDSFAASFGGAIYPSGGLIRCRAAAPVTATLTLTDDDLDGGIEYVGNQAWRDAVNTVRVSFTDPNRDWRQNTTSDISDPDYVTEDGDEVLDDEYPVPLCNDGDCAHRLGRLYLANKREPRTIRARWKAKAFRLREGLTVNVNSVRLGVNEKMMVLERSLRPDGTVDLTLRTETDAKYGAMDDFSQDMPSFGRVDRYDPTEVETPVSEDWSATAAYAENDDQTSKIPVIRVAGGTTDPLIRSVLIEYRKASDEDWTRWQESGNPTSVLVDISGLAPATSYDVAVRYRNVKGVLGERLGLSPVTTGTDFIANDATIPSGLIEDALDAINDRLEETDETLADAAARLAGLGATAAHHSLRNWLDDPLFRTGTAGFVAVEGSILPMAGAPRGLEAVWTFGETGLQDTKILRWPGRMPVKRFNAVQASADVSVTGTVSSVTLQAVWWDAAGDELSTSDIYAGDTGRIGGVVEAPEGAAHVTIRMVPTASEAGIGALRIHQPKAAYALPGQETADPFEDPENETTARIASVERTLAGMAQRQNSLQAETRRGRAGYRENVQAIIDEEAARVSETTSLSTRISDVEGTYLTEAEISAIYLTQSEVDSAIAAFDLSLNATFQSLDGRVTDIEGAGYLTEASADLLFMTSVETDSAIAAFDLSLNATFQSLSDDLATNYYTKAEAGLEFTTLAEVDSAIANFDLSLNADFDGLSSSVSVNATAISDIEGNVAAAYGWTLDVDGKISGMTALSDGSTSTVNFAFDTFVIEGQQRLTFDTGTGTLGLPNIVVDTLEANSVKVNSIDTGHLGTRTAAYVDDHDFCTSTASTTDQTSHFDTLTVDTEAIPVKPGSQLTAKVGYEMSGRYNSYEYLFFRSRIQLRVTRSDDTVVTYTPTTWEESVHIHKTTSNVGGGPSVGNDYQIENQYGKEVVFVLPTTGEPWVYNGSPFKKIALRLIIEAYSPQTSGSQCVFGSIDSAKIKTYQALQDVHAIMEAAIDGPFVNVVKQTVSGSTTTSGGTDGAGAIPVIDWDAGNTIMP